MLMHHEKMERSPALRRLSDPRLLREYAYVGGKWTAADTHRAIEVHNPSDGSWLGTIPDLGATETRRAIEAAADAFVDWKSLLPQDRAARLRRWHDLMIDNRDDLALLMTLEQGKPLAEARGEIDYAASFVEWYAEEARRAYDAPGVTPHLPGRAMMIRREPIGVAAAVTPWNFPSAMITRKAAAALAAGCTMVVRPANETPFSALALAELGERAGLFAGVFNVVTGDPRAVVGELTSNPVVRHVSFTGSTEVGRLLLGQGAPTIKKMSMELGGHAPFLLFPDVDLEQAVAGAVAAKFATTGQDCLAANRFFVHRAVFDAFCDRFAAATAALKVGDGLEDGVDLGPLMHERALLKCEDHVRDAVAKGARLLTGGRRHARGGLFFEPTVLADVTPDMRIWSEETFGPVAAVAAFDDEAEAVQRANDTDYGLAAYLFTNDHGRVHRVSNALEYGMVAVNCVKMTGAPIPFGGVKQSGLGREGGHAGLEDYTETKYVCMAI
jgi:aspartate-semialdehyde dehydrogenase